MNGIPDPGTTFLTVVCCAGGPIIIWFILHLITDLRGEVASIATPRDRSEITRIIPPPP